MVKSQRDSEDITLNENNKRKLEQAAAGIKKEKKTKKKTIKLERNCDDIREGKKCAAKWQQKIVH